MEVEREEELLRARVRQRPAAKGQGKVGPWGSLVLTSRHLIFEATTGMTEAAEDEPNAEVLRVRLADVAAHATTPPAAKLVCLKITTDDEADKATSTQREDDAGSGDDDRTAKKRKSTMAGSGTWVFEFEAGALGERDGFRDLIAQLVPPLRRLKRPKQSAPVQTNASGKPDPVRQQPAIVIDEQVSPEVAKRRDALLESNEEVRELYERLVLSGSITAQEFWQSREHMLDTEAQRLSQQQNAKQAHNYEAGEVRPVAESDTAVQYRLTAADIRKIFTEQPTVKKAFEEWVPHKMSETQFWTKYFQSKYFHRGAKKQDQQAQASETDQSSVPPEAKSIVKKESSTKPEDLRRAMAKIDLSSDLTRNDEQKGYGVGDNETKPKDTKKLSLLQKINQHGTNALGEIEKSLGSRDSDSASMDIDISSSSLTAKDPITKPPAVDIEELKASEAKLAEATLLSELEGKEDNNYVALAIQDHRRYFQNISLVPRESVSESSSPSASVSALQAVLSSLRSEVENVRRKADHPEAGALVDIREAANVMHELDGMCRAASKTGQASTYGLAARDMKMLLGFHERSQELLRHFWRCYPITSRALATKAANVAKAIEELKEEVAAAAGKKGIKTGRQATGDVAEVLISIMRPLTKALEMRDSQRTHI